MNLPRKSYTNLLSEHLRQQKGRVILLAILLFGDIGLQLVSPQIIRRFIDTVQGGTLEMLTHIAILFIAVSIVLAQISKMACVRIGTGHCISTEGVRAEKRDLRPRIG